MLIVKCEDHLAATRAYADGRGPEIRKALEDQLRYLETYRDSTCLCELYWDSAPYSFVFTLRGPLDAKGERAVWFQGGLIHYAPRETGVGGPQFSVSLAGAGFDEGQPERWEVHT